MRRVAYFGGYFLGMCLLFIFGVSFFKSLGFPLLNNEEAKTAVFAQRILRFGYPKLSDGKNALYLWEDSSLPTELVVLLPTFPWLKYYFALLGGILAHFTDDFFLKTALFRLPFSVIGVIGFFVFLKTLVRFLDNKIAKLWLFNFFLLFTLLSVDITLAIREASFASLTIFFSALVFQTLFGYILFGEISYQRYLRRATLFLFLLFLSSSLSYFLTSVLFSLFIFFLGRKELAEAKKGLYPFLFSFFLGLPFLLFSYIFKFLNPPPAFVLENQRELWQNQSILTQIKGYLNLEFFPLSFLILFLLILFRLLRLLKREEEKKAFSALMLLFGYFVLEILLGLSTGSSALSPFIFWQPASVGFTLLGGYLVFTALQKLKDSLLKEATLGLLPAFLLAGFILLLPAKLPLLHTHFAALFKPTWGPREYLVSYLQRQAKDREMLIATNFEEMPYIYYLNAQVLTPEKLDKNRSVDFSQAPTTIIPRKQFTSSFLLMHFYKKDLEANYYRKIVLPVTDAYTYNSFLRFAHQSASLVAKDASEALWLFEKREAAL